MGTRPQLYFLAPKSSNFVVSQPSLESHLKESPVAPPEPGSRIRCGDHSFCFLLCKKFHGSAFVAFSGNCENSLALEGERRLGDRHVPEESMKCAETDVPCPRTVATLKLKMVERQI